MCRRSSRQSGATSRADGTFDRGPSLPQDARKQHEHDQIERKQKSQRRIDRLAETDQRRLEAVRLGKRRHGRPIQRDEIVPARNEPSNERRGDHSGRADAQQQAPVEQARAQHRLPQRSAEQHHEEAGEAIFAEQAETDDRPEQDVVDTPAPPRRSA